MSDERIERARDVSIEKVIARRNIKLRRQGKELVGPCPKCGGTDRFSIHPAKGVWNCRSCKPTDIAGDVIGLTQWLDRCDFSTAIETLSRDWRPPARPVDQIARREKADTDEKRQHEKAGWLWRQRRPITGTPAETYLRQVRRISCALPPTLAFLPPGKPEQHPALISAYAAPVELDSGALGDPLNVMAVHLTLLRADGSGKADVDPNKISVGSPLGVPIALAPINDLLALSIAEGIEDGLTICEALGMGVWAAGSASYLPALVDAVPDYVTSVSIFEDADDAGRKQSRDLAQRIRARKPRKGNRPGDLAERPIEVILRRLT
jgi:putative DNA primase/helicase